MYLTIDDIKLFNIKIFGSDYVFDEYGFAYDGDGLRLDYLQKIGTNEYNIKALWWQGNDSDIPPMAFYIKNVKNKLLIFHIIEVNAQDKYWNTPVYGALFSPVYTGDGQHWHRIQNRSYDTGSNTYTFSFTPEYDIVEISRYFNRSYAECLALFQPYIGNPYAHITQAGTSKQGRQIQMVELTNPFIPESQKERVVAIAQQHTGETQGSYFMRGACDYILSHQNFLDTMHYYFIPMMNPDGVYHQVARVTPDGVDLNRAWDKNSGQSGYAIEVASIRNTILAVHQEKPIKAFIDIHGLAGGAAGHTLSPNTICPEAFSTQWGLLNKLPMGLECYMPGGAGNNIAKGWAASIGIPNTYTYEPTEIDWRITDDMLYLHGQAFAEAAYQAYH